MRHYFLFLALMLLPLFSQARAAEHAVILMYHHVSATTPASTSIDPALFAQHLDHFAQHGYQVMDLPELLKSLQDGQPVPKKSIALTFDDAYRSVYENAYPLLRQRGWPFTIFVNSDPVDRNFSSHASWAQLQEMAAAGATLANHSASHSHLGARLPGEGRQAWQQRIRQDIETAQQRIKEETGQDHRLFAYPYGEFTPELQQLLTRLGYISLGQQSGPVGFQTDFSAVPRFPMAASYATLPELREKLATRPLPLAAVDRPGNPLPSGAQPILSITLQRPLTRADALRCYASGQGAIPVSWENERRFTAQAEQPLAAGRTRYNCTAPASAGGFYWYSAPWVSLDATGRWPRD